MKLLKISICKIKFPVFCIATAANETIKQLKLFRLLFEKELEEMMYKNQSWLILIHSVSLDTDPSLANDNPGIFSVPQALKNSISPPR